MVKIAIGRVIHLGEAFDPSQAPYGSKYLEKCDT